MCGIAGIIEARGKTPDRNELEIMADRIKKRGPDNLGISIYDQVGFAHRRLSIIDLTQEANQPFEINFEGYIYSITYNGEIYNFKEIRDSLEKEGVIFTTASDTEVILRAYIRRGANFVSSLKGMFALAIYDPKDM